MTYSLKFKLMKQSTDSFWLEYFTSLTSDPGASTFTPSNEERGGMEFWEEVND